MDDEIATHVADRLCALVKRLVELSDRSLPERQLRHEIRDIAASINGLAWSLTRVGRRAAGRANSVHWTDFRAGSPPRRTDETVSAPTGARHSGSGRPCSLT